jgi:hypothetical protein
MTRAESIDLLEAVKVTLATNEPVKPVEARKAVYLSCIATTLLVIAHTIIENPYPDI